MASGSRDAQHEASPNIRPPYPCVYPAAGVPTCASSDLTKALRGQWNYTGYITSDSGALEDIYTQHHYVATEQARARGQGGVHRVRSVSFSPPPFLYAAGGSLCRHRQRHVRRLLRRCLPRRADPCGAGAFDDEGCGSAAREEGRASLLPLLRRLASAAWTPSTRPSSGRSRCASTWASSTPRPTSRTGPSRPRRSTRRHAKATPLPPPRCQRGSHAAPCLRSAGCARPEPAGYALWPRPPPGTPLRRTLCVSGETLPPHRHRRTRAPCFRSRRARSLPSSAPTRRCVRARDKRVLLPRLRMGTPLCTPIHGVPCSNPAGRSGIPGQLPRPDLPGQHERLRYAAQCRNRKRKCRRNHAGSECVRVTRCGLKVPLPLTTAAQVSEGCSISSTSKSGFAAAVALAQARASVGSCRIH